MITRLYHLVYINIFFNKKQSYELNIKSNYNQWRKYLLTKEKKLVFLYFYDRCLHLGFYPRFLCEKKKNMFK